MMDANLSYANGRFEDIHPRHFLQLMTVTEDIMLKRDASKEANLGEPATPNKSQGRDRGPYLPPGNASQWQRKELAKEIKSNATVANAGDIGDLQVVVGDYQNSTKFFTHRRTRAGALLFGSMHSHHASTVGFLTTSTLHAKGATAA